MGFTLKGVIEGKNISSFRRVPREKNIDNFIVLAMLNRKFVFI